MIVAVKRQGLAEVVLRVVGQPGALVTLIGSLFAVFACRAATSPVDDLDVWWIAAAGRDMLGTSTVPVANAYSYTAPATPWVMHELAFGVLYAVGLETFGPSFFPLLTVLAAAAVVAVGAGAIVRETRHPASAAIALLVLLVGCREGLFAARPSHTAIVLPVLMTALTLAPGWSVVRALAVIVLEIAWTNAHGSFPLGIAILVVGLFIDSANRRPRIAATVSAALATLVNPYGIRLHGLVGGYAFGGDATSRIIHDHIVEFFPIWRGWSVVNPLNGAALVTVLALALRALREQKHVARAMLSLLLVAMALYQVRHVVLAVAVSALLLHEVIDDLLAGEGAAAGTLPRWIAPAIVIPGLCLAVAVWSSERSTRPAADWIAADTGGAPFVRLVSRLPARSRVYVPFESGGLAIWLGTERGTRVFFDSRNDCYPPEVAEAGFALERPQSPEWVDRTLSGYGTNVALVSTVHPVYTALVSSPGWQIARSDGGWTEFRR